MNILIYSVNPQSPHLETDIELALKLKDEGSKVTIVRCQGELKSCLANPKHNYFICAACKSKYKYAIQLTQLTDINIISILINNSQYKEIPNSFANIDELKSFQFHGARLGLAVASTLIGRCNYDHKFDTIKYKKEIKTELKMSIDVYLGMEKILNDIQPNVVYFFNGRFSPYHPLKLLCLKNKITFYTHERAGVINKYILRENSMPHDIDYALKEMETLWDNAKDNKEQTGTKFFIDRRNKVIQSWISFTASQKHGLLPANFDHKKRNIAIFNSTMEEYEGLEGWENPIYTDDNEGIRKILESFKEEDYIFYLRIHPNMKFLKNTQIKEIENIAQQYKNLCIIKPEETLDSYALMDYADKVITFGSTMGVEATFWGKPSILLGKSLYMNIDACYQPTTHEKAVALIKEDTLQPKAKINAIKYGYWELMKGEYFQKFNQVNLFSTTFNGKKIEANKILQIVEKIAKLRLIKNKREVNNLKNKITSLFK